MAVSPPKCRTCGKIEWRHVCGGLPEQHITPAIAAFIAAPTEAPKPKTDRKEYLKLKARERRARQAAEKAAK